MSTSANAKIWTILVELDCLLDTRLGTLARMGIEHAARILDAAYLAREEDVFDGIDMEAYRRLYRARDLETLRHSRITKLTVHFKALIQALGELAMARPYFDGVRVAVNTYPYQMDGETLNAVAQAVAAWIGGLAPVEAVSIAPLQLTPAYVKSHLAMLVMYEYEAWMNLHAVAFRETRLHEINLVAPALYFNGRPDEDTLHALVHDTAHPFVAMTMLASPLVGLELIDASYFSIATPEDTAA